MTRFFGNQLVELDLLVGIDMDVTELFNFTHGHKSRGLTNWMFCIYVLENNI